MPAPLGHEQVSCSFQFWLRSLNATSQPHSNVTMRPPVVRPLPPPSRSIPYHAFLNDLGRSYAALCSSDSLRSPCHRVLAHTVSSAWYTQFPKSHFRPQLLCRFLKEGFPGTPASLRCFCWGFHSIVSLFFLAFVVFMISTLTHSLFNVFPAGL